jgi:16S rRNA processing protein RimM
MPTLRGWHFYSIMTREELYPIGYIRKPHGLKGEVTVVLLPESPEPDTIRTVYILQKGTFVPYVLQRFSQRPDQLFVSWEDVTTWEGADQLKGCEIFLPKTERPRLARGEFYNDEVVGFEVMMGGDVLGRVLEVSEQGPNRFLVLDNERATLIPVHGPFIKSISKTKRHIRVDLPEGFLDL